MTEMRDLQILEKDGEKNLLATHRFFLLISNGIREELKKYSRLQRYLAYQAEDFMSYEEKKRIIPEELRNSPEDLKKFKEDRLKLEYEFLVRELSLEFLKAYKFQVMLQQTSKTPDNYQNYWLKTKGAFTSVVRNIVNDKIKKLRKEYRQKCIQAFFSDPRTVYWSELSESSIQSNHSAEMKIADYLSKANLNQKEMQAVYNFMERDESLSEEIIDKIRLANSYEERHAESRESAKKAVINPLLGKSPTECCEYINGFAAEFFFNLLVGNLKSKNLYRQDEWNHLRKFLPFLPPNPLFAPPLACPKKIASNMGLTAQKLMKTLTKICPLAIHEIMGARTNKQSTYLIDENLFSAFFPIIRPLFKMEKKYRGWLAMIKQELGYRDRSGPVQFVKRKIKSGVVPDYYFEVVPPTPDRVKLIKNLKNERVNEPEGIWMEGDAKPLTRKEIQKSLQLTCPQETGPLPG